MRKGQNESVRGIRSKKNGQREKLRGREPKVVREMDRGGRREGERVGEAQRL